MTATSSQVLATMPRLWVIMSIDVPRRFRSSLIIVSTWAWMVTSRAVVGSSAMSSAGSQARAMAMTTRCFMPPENWWGYSPFRAAWMPTMPSISSTLRSTSAFAMPFVVQEDRLARSARPRS